MTEIMTEVLRQLEGFDFLVTVDFVVGGESISAKGCLSQLLLEAVFADDCALCITTSDPRNLCVAIAKATATATDVFCEYGLVLNFKQGKSEVMLKHNGDLSRRCDTAVWAMDTPAVNFMSEHFGMCTILAV